MGYLIDYKNITRILVTITYNINYDYKRLNIENNYSRLYIENDYTLKLMLYCIHNYENITGNCILK